MNNEFAIVVAMDQSRGIGKEGKLPWHLPEDLKHFKELTSGADRSKKNAVIMGRKTWESLPEKFRPLPGRLNVVLTRNTGLIFPKEVLKADSLDSALELLKRATNPGEIFVIGGAEIFQQALHHPQCRRIYLTQILKQFDCDTFFPLLSAEWKTASPSQEFSDQSLEYFFAEYTR